MVDALTAYHMRIGEWESALELWRKAPAEPAYERQRLCGMVKVHLHRALQTAKEGLTRLAVDQLQVDLGSEVQSPGNTASLLNDAERELRELNEAIQRLVNLFPSIKF
jgi:hypothetical protein